ncbi:MAG TPA: response regulator, partial [Vicinamibacterales bacterium]|nr:response regulator [Vicinamibacterales bacterium]
MEGPIKLLIVDDDDVDRLALKRTLALAGVEADVAEAAGQEEALALLRDTKFDCVILDYQLPGTDGLQVLHSIRAVGNRTPVIALTGQGDEQTAVELMKAGAADYLGKGQLSPERLSRSLRHALALYRSEEARRQLLEREKAAREEAQAANRAKDEFLATLSHELRTPLNAVVGWSRLLRGDRLSPEARARALAAIERNATVQARLIEDLLDISSVIRGKFRLEVEPLDLRTVVDAAVEIVKPGASAKDVAIAIEIAEGSGLVTGDPQRLQQVLWNLLSNSVKFTPPGG